MTTNVVDSAIVKSVIDKKNTLDETLKKYKIFADKLKFVMEKYVNNPKDKENIVEKIVTINGEKYYVTPQGILQKKNSKNEDCPINSVDNLANTNLLNNGLMSDVPIDYNPVNYDESKSYMLLGDELKPGQPCNNRNSQFSVNLPDKSTKTNYDMCSYLYTNQYVHHDDLGPTTIENCRTRAEDIGHNAFGISEVNPISMLGKCYTAPEYNKITKREAIQELNMDVVTDTGISNGTFTLLKNGNAIYWSGSNSYKDNNNELKMNSDDGTPLAKWQSINEGGKQINECHPIYGGSINTIEATYGVNCGLDFSNS